MLREPVVAGHFYPGEARSLRRVVESFLEASKSPLDARAILSPHAGYVYSGAVAGAVMSAVRLPRRFIILGPNHTGRGESLALFPEGDWLTPLGKSSIDAGINRRLREECPQLREDAAAHAREHSLEVQLPFLQALLPEFTFSAICVGTSDLSHLEALGAALARTIQSLADPILMVVSSDMTHYESADAAEKKDRMAIHEVLAVDPLGLHRTVSRHNISMCGFAPAVAALAACKRLGSKEGRLIRYAHSGEVSGDFSSVVGYAGLAVL